MNKIIKQIQCATHIEIEVTEECLALGSAFYTYILTQHKKASFVCKTKDINLKYSFLPWFEKLRTTNYSSADLSLQIEGSAKEFFEIFSTLDIKINAKMATALYGALILETDNFTNTKLSGTYFAIASKLVESGADYRLCIENLVKRATLSEFRLKAIMFKKMCLKESARVAFFEISEDDLKSSGTTIEDAELIMKDSFNLAYVEKAVLIYEKKKKKTIEKEI